MTPAGTSNELDVQNGWEENTHTHTVSSDSDGVLKKEMLTTISRALIDRSVLCQDVCTNILMALLGHDDGTCSTVVVLW